MNIAEYATIIGTGIAVTGFIYAFLRNFKSDLNTRFDKMETRMDKNETRIDHLYEICVEILKTRR